MFLRISCAPPNQEYSKYGSSVVLSGHQKDCSASYFNSSVVCTCGLYIKKMFFVRHAHVISYWFIIESFNIRHEFSLNKKKHPKTSHIADCSDFWSVFLYRVVLDSWMSLDFFSVDKSQQEWLLHITTITEQNSFHRWSKRNQSFRKDIEIKEDQSRDEKTTSIHISLLSKFTETSTIP